MSYANSFFKERRSAQTKVEVLTGIAPVVWISSVALDKMRIYTDKCTDEIGWLATATREKNEIFITDAYLFDQEVHGTTTEITPEGLEAFAMDLLQQPDGMEIWNSMKVWGHSHVNMGVTPSGQDNSQMRTFAESGHEWFVRLICNKKGDMKIDVYDYGTGVIYNDVPWAEHADDAVLVVQDRIDQLLAEIKELRQGTYKTLTAPIEEEMKAKVKKKTYANTWTNRQSTLDDWNSPYGYYQNGKFIRYDQATIAKNLAEEEKKKTQALTTTITEESSTTDAHYRFDYLKNDADVHATFSDTELFQLSYCDDIDALDADLAEYGWQNWFSDNDLKRILRVAHKEYKGVSGQ